MTLQYAVHGCAKAAAPVYRTADRLSRLPGYAAAVACNSDTTTTTGILLQAPNCPDSLPAEDVGDTPLELLQPVLLQCNAEQLASIEDGTRFETVAGPAQQFNKLHS